MEKSNEELMLSAEIDALVEMICELEAENADAGIILNAIKTLRYKKYQLKKLIDE